MPDTAPEGAPPGTAQIKAELRYSAGALALDVRFTLREPWSVLFAPSGAGKSTVLRLIAGLIQPTAGRIVSLEGGQRDGPGIVLTDTKTSVFLPSHRRGMGLVAQEPALFPHMSVLRNVLYGVRRDGSSAGVTMAEEAMQLCRVAHLAAERPEEISGGERQRVALARALAARPRRLLMLDEPFTGTEAALRDVLTAELRVWLRRSGTPVLQVTHDLGDVLAAEAEVLLMEGGRVVAQGRPEVVLRSQIHRLTRQLRDSGATT